MTENGRARVSLGVGNGSDRESEVLHLEQQRRILLKDGVVLTLDREVGDFAKGDILIKDGTIMKVSPSIEIPADTAVIDASSHIIIPGFVDTHSHSYQGLLRGLLPNGVVFPDYDRDIQKNLTLHYLASDAYAGVLMTALGMIESGTTTVVDISQVAHTPEHTDANIQALRDAGIRAVFAYSRGVGPHCRYPDDIERLLPAYFNSSDQLLTPALAVSLEEEAFRAARRAGVRAVSHLRLNSEPLLRLAQAGLLRPGDEFIHCTHLSGEAWSTMKDAGARVSHSPPLEMAMGHGMPSIQDAIDHGLSPSLSADHSATVAQDMFGIMRTTFNLQRLLVQQRARDGEMTPPPLLTCREVLEFATIEGARCANLDHKIGTLTPGKKADIVMLRFDRLDIWPTNNAYATVVNLMSPRHVDAVFINGAVKKWQGELVRIDTPHVLQLASDARDAVVQRAGYESYFLE